MAIKTLTHCPYCNTKNSILIDENIFQHDIQCGHCLHTYKLKANITLDTEITPYLLHFRHCVAEMLLTTVTSICSTYFGYNHKRITLGNEVQEHMACGKQDFHFLLCFSGYKTRYKVVEKRTLEFAFNACGDIHVFVRVEHPHYTYTRRYNISDDFVGSTFGNKVEHIIRKVLLTWTPLNENTCVRYQEREDNEHENETSI